MLAINSMCIPVCKVHYSSPMKRILSLCQSSTYYQINHLVEAQLFIELI